MAENRKGSPHQAKHFQPEDHAHAAHQQDAARGHEPKRGHGAKKDDDKPTRKAGHPVERTPKGPSKGQ
jgi:hypothetical protein